MRWTLMKTTWRKISIATIRTADHWKGQPTPRKRAKKEMHKVKWKPCSEHSSSRRFYCAIYKLILPESNWRQWRSHRHRRIYNSGQQVKCVCGWNKFTHRFRDRSLYFAHQASHRTGSRRNGITFISSTHFEFDSRPISENKTKKWRKL